MFCVDLHGIYRFRAVCVCVCFMKWYSVSVQMTDSWKCVCVCFRYRLSGLILPSLKDWFEGTFGANLQHKSPATVSGVCVRQLCVRL